MKGKRKEIADYLVSKLGLPENVCEFKMNFYLDKPIIVECKYCPVEKEEK